MGKLIIRRSEEVIDIYDEILLQLFFFHKTFFSFKSPDGYLFYRKADDLENIWTKTTFNPSTMNIEELNSEHINSIDIFKGYMKDVIMDVNIPLTFSDLYDLYKTNLSSFYKKYPDLFILILFKYFVKKETEIVLNHSIYDKYINVIEQIMKFNTLSEQLDFIKIFVNKSIYKKFNDDNEKFLEKFLENIYGKDSKTISKINSFFDCKVNLPGKYLVRHNELILEALLLKY